MTPQQIKKTYDEKFIKGKLSTDVNWVEKGLKTIYQNQTIDEKKERTVDNKNGIGFTSYDGRYLSWVSEWLVKGNHLNDKHLEKVKHRLPKYWKQIQNEILKKNGH